MKKIHGGVASPLGFKASGMHCGVRVSRRNDLALIFSNRPCQAAGVFTTNKVQASCVVINKQHLISGRAQAIIANSGNANCMTGKQGFRHSKEIIQTVAHELKVSPKSILIAATGVIGKLLPIKKILTAIPELVENLSRKGSARAAQGIMTTDHVVKEVAAECMIGNRPVRIGAIAKGAGMIHPEMALSSRKHATLLCFVTTDAAIEAEALRSALSAAVQDSFNLITIDRDMSTNDMVLVLANGAARNVRIEKDSKNLEKFVATLSALFLALAKLMVRDAEGATKFVEIMVKNAESATDARAVARSVASSNLLKCALFGSDPNWGRIAAAAGSAAANVDPWKMRIHIGNILVVKNGGGVVRDNRKLDRIFSRKNIRIVVDLGVGPSSATAYTCDLSTEYVRFNSAYKT
ncbi:bifunctional ornithine acetyltransferase/N-acetylglutamate synthase [Candidatus Kaiserbacteria bacterium RIFCSPLOWO2_01_FULL_54_13]|uniref:Arginine biosynthesis bifunctional protein ArgJ n=1 Tax=Candidatus Kaiserbacteria bacterium RIFCSPLOWO2_01_FULL_54_13 TaxID=1798512 RepID=A0A1F6F3Y8_9BACT|nr:MAG: bifunctional ornithine acetyltransferase/N-acetylglutamate synthase [Candidatus Kaiserbacteria bacterium RIFCSPLOWO2_01_FULL_54_13]